MKKSFIEKTLEVIDYGIEKEAAHISMQEEQFTGNNIKYKDKHLTGFIFCDYLGLSSDTRIKESTKAAVDKYGAFTSVSRTYLKLGYYDELEDLMSRIFGKPVILISRTSLAHIAVLPVIVQQDDAVILDQYLHDSVRTSAYILQASGNHVEIVRHSNLEKIEGKILELRKKHRKIWYCTDGVYSMHGDTFFAEQIYALLEKYEEFNVYVDDSHGMSWAGENGRGFTLGKIPYHPRLFLISSLAKGFGTGGCAIVCPDEQAKDLLIKCGAPLIFSGPITPPTLGAIEASTKIHLSNEIKEKQRRLDELIEYFYKVANEKNVPIVKKNDNTPIMFIPTGKPDMGVDISSNMKNQGFFVTCGAYPAVPYNNSGIRAILSLYHTEKDIYNFLDALSYEMQEALKQRSIDLEDLLGWYKHVVMA